MEQFFVGSWTHRLDGKGRVSLPADYREVLRNHGSEKTFFLVPALPGTAFHIAFSSTAYNRLIERLGQTQYASAAQRAETRRLYIAEARRIGIEDGGRFVLSKDMRDRLGLSDEVRFHGDGETFRLYDPATYERLHGPAVQAEVAPAEIDFGGLV